MTGLVWRPVYAYDCKNIRVGFFLTMYEARAPYLRRMNAAELILNPDGSIYHLALHPEQIADLIILVGDPDRVTRVSRHFDRIECRVQKREFVTHTGYLGSRRLSVLSTGIGTDNIDIALNELDALHNIDFATRALRLRPASLRIIRVGTCGGLQSEPEPGDIVVSEAAFGFDGLMRYYRAPDQHRSPELHAWHTHAAHLQPFPIAPYFARASARLLSEFEGFGRKGFTATQAGFYGPQGRVLRAPTMAPDYLDTMAAYAFEDRRILNLEMETAGIYGLAQMLGHEALSLSVILANRPRGLFSKDPGGAIDRLISQVLSKINLEAFGVA
ncbi:MAG: nucleoside phosphorylase [Saprospiraceae bacterium]